MKRFFLLFLCTLIMGCENSSPEEKVPEPELLEFSYYDFKIHYNDTSAKQFYCKDSSLWYVSMVSEIIDEDTTNYTFKEGDEVKGDWFTISKDDSLLNVSMGINKLWGERYLKIH